MTSGLITVMWDTSGYWCKSLSRICRVHAERVNVKDSNEALALVVKGVSSLTSGNPDNTAKNSPNSGAETDQVKQSAGEVADQAKQAVGQVKDQAKQTAQSQLAMRKDQTAQGLTVASSAVHDLANSLRQNDQTSSYAQYADQAADRIQRIGSYLRGRDIGQIAEEAEDWARREPVLALGGAFVLGVLAARFIKSSRPQRATGGTNSGYDQYNRDGYTRNSGNSFHLEQRRVYDDDPERVVRTPPAGRSAQAPERMGISGIDSIDSEEAQH